MNPDTVFHLRRIANALERLADRFDKPPVTAASSDLPAETGALRFCPRCGEKFPLNLDPVLDCLRCPQCNNTYSKP